MTTTTPPTTSTPIHEQHGDRARRSPCARVVRVELRKMFDTRSGFWLMASIVIVGVLAPRSATILFAPDDRT